MQAKVTYTLEQGIATIRMDDGKANALGPDMLAELHAAFERALADKAVVLLCGRERMFSGGFDLGVFKRGGEPLAGMLEAGARLCERMLDYPRPIVAACTGHAVAMGVFLLLGADLRIGVDADARVQANEVQIGMTLPHFAIETSRLRLQGHHLHNLLGLAQPYDPKQALAADIFSELAASDAILDIAQARAKALTALHAHAFMETKARLTQDARAALAAAIREDLTDWKKMFGSVV